MSRAYRIAVRESVKRIVRARDHVSTDLEILEILPREQMADLLRKELEQRGFVQEGKQMVRRNGGIAVSVDPGTGEVVVSSDLEKEVEVEGERVGRSYDESGASAKQMRETLRKELREDLEKKVQQREAELQTQATDQLEAELANLRGELNQAVNKVTAEALKQKAAQIGQIKELTEDPESGELTIVVEV